MARFLFVVPPATGHVNPTVSVARALEKRGHAVAWAAHPGHVRPLLPPGATLLPLDDALPGEDYERLRARSLEVRGPAAFKFLWEEVFLPLGRVMQPGVEAAVAAFAPDALVVDQQALAGAIVARRRGLPWATFVTTSATVVDALDTLPRVRAWLEERLADLQREAGLEVLPEGTISPARVIVFSTPALVGNDHSFPSHYAFVGPSIADRPDVVDFPWEALGDQPKVLISLGTVNAERGGRFYREAVEAVRGEPLQAIFAAPPERVGEVPENVIVRGYVPQLKLLPRLDAVVCHAGHNTVAEALAHGLPLVVAPIKDDQPVVAEQVERAGAGIRVRFGRVRVDGLRAAIREVLADPAYREAAARIRASFVAAGGAARAAELLEGLT